MSSDYLYIGEDNVLWFKDAVDSVDATAVTTGTGTFAVKDSEFESLATGSLTHQSAGTWYGVLDKDAWDADEGDVIYVELTIASSGRDAFRRLRRVAKYHGNV